MGRVIQIDPFGDLILVVGATSTDPTDPDSSPKKFLVSSRTLCDASPAFKVMLYGEDDPDDNYKGAWAANLPEPSVMEEFVDGLKSLFSGEDSVPDDRYKDIDAWTVTFPDESPSAMDVVLKALHRKRWFDDVPDRLTFSTLYAVVVLLEKYDQFTAVHPWIPVWMSYLNRTNMNQLLRTWRGLWIAWRLADPFRLPMCVESLAYRGTLNDEGEFVDVEKQSFENSGVLLPAWLPEDIKALRARNIEVVMDRVMHSFKLRPFHKSPGGIKVELSNAEREFREELLLDFGGATISVADFLSRRRAYHDDSCEPDRRRAGALDPGSRSTRLSFMEAFGAERRVLGPAFGTPLGPRYGEEILTSIREQRDRVGIIWPGLLSDQRFYKEAMGLVGE